MPFLIEPDQAAQAIMRDLDKTHFEIVFPKRFAWLMKLLRLMPYAVYFALTKRAAVWRLPNAISIFLVIYRQKN